MCKREKQNVVQHSYGCVQERAKEFVQERAKCGVALLRFRLNNPTRAPVYSATLLHLSCTSPAPLLSNTEWCTTAVYHKGRVTHSVLLGAPHRAPWVACTCHTGRQGWFARSGAYDRTGRGARSGALDRTGRGAHSGARSGARSRAVLALRALRTGGPDTGAVRYVMI